MEPREVQHLVVAGQVPLKKDCHRATLDVRALILEVEQSPQLEARVRYSQLDAVVLSELPGLIEIGMLVDVEDAPNLIEQQVVVSLPPGLGRGFSTKSHGLLNDNERHAGFLSDHDLNSRVAGFLSEITEVGAFGDAPFADDQDALPGLP